MSCLQKRGWPDSIAWKNEAALKGAATNTLQFAKNLLKAAEQSYNSRLAKIIWPAARSICERVTVGSGTQPEHKLDLSGASEAFLELATDIESLLSDLLLESEEDLSGMMDMMGRVNLGPQPQASRPQASQPRAYQPRAYQPR